MQGGQLYGQQVLADIAGNLTLRSEQDSNRYQRRDQSAGIDVAVGTGGASVSGSYNQARIDSNYTSVVEQSGIQAGEGGFAIRVGGHTQLDGAAIASSADASRNLLVTGSLGASDLRNSAEYKASSVGFSASGGSNGGSVSPNIAPPQQDSASSTTRAGLADGLVLIGDGDTRALDSIERGVSELQQDGLAQIFDEQKLHQRMELGQVAGEVGFAAGKGLIAYQRDQAEAKALAAQQSMLEVQSSGDEARIQRARAELIAASDAVTAWSDGGIAKQITQALAGGLSGAAGGGDVLAAVGAVVVNEAALSQFATGLRRAGVDPDSAAHDSVMNLMGAVLGAVGGALAGDAEGGAAVGSAAQQFGYFDYREGNAYLLDQQQQLLDARTDLDAATRAGIGSVLDNCMKLGCSPAALVSALKSPGGLDELIKIAQPDIEAQRAYGKGFNQLSQTEQESVLLSMARVGTVSVDHVEYLSPTGEVVRTPVVASPEEAAHNGREKVGLVLANLAQAGGQRVESVVNWMGADNAQTAALLMMAAVGGPVKAGASYLFDAALGDYIQTNKERYVVNPLSRVFGNVAFGAQNEERLQQVHPASHALASLLTDAAGASLGAIAAKTGAAGIVASSRGLKGKVDAADGREVLGGPHRETSKPAGDGFDSHHCPAQSCYKYAPISSKDGPAIKMELGDHRATSSYGFKPEAKASRDRNQSLLEQGRLREAIQMDTDDIRSRFGNKYDSEVAEMIRCAEILDPRSFVNGN